MYQTIEELTRLARERDCPLWQIVLEGEQALTGLGEEEIWRRLEQRYDIMFQSATKALDRGLGAGTLIDGVSARQQSYGDGPGSITGGFVNRLMARALSGSECNAAMGRICAAPTAGSCGILPAVLLSVGERYSLDKRTVLEGLMTASGLGGIVMENATVAGAEGGCQAECGVAAAMAAAAAVQMAGGDNDTAIHAFGLTLMNCMGLICDPIAGLVQIPCAQRNASQAVNAVLSADMALAGMHSPIPADEMVEAMFQVGQMMPRQLRETALGGIAASPAAKAIQASLDGA